METIHPTSPFPALALTIKAKTQAYHPSKMHPTKGFPLLPTSISLLPSEVETAMIRSFEQLTLLAPRASIIDINKQTSNETHEARQLVRF